MLALAPRTAGSVPPPTDREVDLWVIDVAGRGEAGDRRLLAADELARADRFRTAGLRQRFTAARAALRRVLAGYLGLAPESVTFVYGGRGKPALPGGELAFNLSHSGPLAVCAVTRQASVGTDVEEIRVCERAGAIAARFFSAAETREIVARSGHERDLAFLRAWTRKEACLKASGEGLHLPLTAFDVPVDGRAWCDVATAAGSYRVWAYELGATHVGATALPAGDWQPRAFALR